MMISLLEMLKLHSLFASLDHTFLSRLAAQAALRSFGSGEIVFLKGDPGDGLYGVGEGRVKIVAESVRGQERLLNLLEPGELFGEIALLDGGTRTATAVTSGRVELLFVHRRSFVELLSEHPAVAQSLLALVCRRLRWVNELLEDSAFLTGPERLAKRLLALHHQAPDQPVRISQQELAHFTGLSRQSVNQHLGAWAADGHLSLTRGRIRVLDAAALERWKSAAGEEGA